MSNDVDLERGQPQDSQEQQKKGEEEEEVPWEKDPANPLNWPKWKRIYHTLIPGEHGISNFPMAHTDLVISRLRIRMYHCELNLHSWS